MLSNTLYEETRAEERYVPDTDERAFLQKAYSDFLYDQQSKNKSWHILGDRDIRSFWDDCNKDYNVYIPPQRPDDWMKMYRKPISRNKANEMISYLTQSMMTPKVRAQNKDQEIDRILSRVGRALLDYAEINDGKPTKSASRKFVDLVHKGVIEGTIHAQVDFDVETGKAVKELIPNEEIYISNPWQADIQKQRHVFRFQDKVLYEEAEQEFGDLPNWKYVVPGPNMNWAVGQTQFFKELDFGYLKANQVHIVRIWRPVPKDKLTKGRKKEKYFNVLVNGVLMFPVENKSPYKHGEYPIGKEVFEMFDANFYWGNSLINKMRHEQAIYDSYNTLVLNKGKLNINPPMASLNGLHIDQDVVRPGAISSVSSDPTKDLVKIPGVADPISNADFAILNLLEGGLSSSASTADALSGGGQRRKTATEVVRQQENQRQLLGLFQNLIANLIEQLGYLNLRNLVQFMPRQKINDIAKVSVPDQNLATGKRGTMEIIFEKPKLMTADELFAKSEEIMKQQEAQAAQGEPKEILYINPAYLDELDLYVSVDAETLIRPSTSLEKAMAMEKYQLYATSLLISQEENIRQLVRGMGDDEDLLVKAAQPQQAPSPMLPGGQAAPQGSVTPVARQLTQSPNQLLGQPQGA